MCCELNLTTKVQTGNVWQNDDVQTIGMIGLEFEAWEMFQIIAILFFSDEVLTISPDLMELKYFLNRITF